MIIDENPVWNGSATELVALLSEDLQPNILTRRLNVKAGELRNEYGIEYTMKRTRNRSSRPHRKIRRFEDGWQRGFVKFSLPVGGSLKQIRLRKVCQPRRLARMRVHPAN